MRARSRLAACVVANHGSPGLVSRNPCWVFGVKRFGSSAGGAGTIMAANKRAGGSSGPVPFPPSFRRLMTGLAIGSLALLVSCASDRALDTLRSELDSIPLFEGWDIIRNSEQPCGFGAPDNRCEIFRGYRGQGPSARALRTLERQLSARGYHVESSPDAWPCQLFMIRSQPPAIEMAVTTTASDFTGPTKDDPTGCPKGNEPFNLAIQMATFVGQAPPPLEPPPATVLGNLEIHFAAANDRAKVPGPLTEVEVIIRPLDADIGEGHDIGSGDSFRLSLPPGRYRFENLGLKAGAFGKEKVLLSVTGPSFEVPANGCVYLGRIVFSFVRLPPGSPDAQSKALMKYIERTGGDPTTQLEWTVVEGGGVSGGLVNVDLPPPEVRPPGWEECTVSEARV